MTVEEFYRAVAGAGTVSEVEEALTAFSAEHSAELAWKPFGGKPNNRGVIELSADPGRSVVERLTNSIDAVLELEHERHRGLPTCRTPREGASAWLNVPEGGLSEMTAAQRRALAHRVVVKLLPGDSREQRTVEVQDGGIGLAADEMPNTILSLNESNKWQKHYLAGTYGQGGSSTLAVSRYTFIASRRSDDLPVGFTIVRYLDLPPEEYKTGHYVYLCMGGKVLEGKLQAEELGTGTLVKHFGYDLSSYPSPVGPNSVYGLLNETLFDPVMPVWLDNRIHDYRRVIKGSRNALNGALDEGDEERRGPRIAHPMPMFHVPLEDYGRIGIEYWVLERPSRENKRPSAAYVNPSKPIVLTLNGQAHAELSSVVIRKHAELPYLTQRLICHLDCNDLTAAAKRALFASTREEARRGIVYERIEEELVKALRSDDELIRLNNEARQAGMRERDETATQEMRKEVARLLRIHGVSVAETGGEQPSGKEGVGQRPTRPRVPRPKPQPIEPHEPPTYIRIVWDEEADISFYADQRRYMRIETDANSSYYNPKDPAASRINIIVTGAEIRCSGSTPLQGGRMRAILECLPVSTVGAVGHVRVELSRPGLPTLSDERGYRIIEKPPSRPSDQQLTLPPFDWIPVDGPEDQRWTDLGWPEDVNAVASSAEMENGKLVIYYSTVFPPYTAQLRGVEQRNVGFGASFTGRYKIWLAVHSLILRRDQELAHEHQPDLFSEQEEAREREERCRTAKLSALFAAREVQLEPTTVETE